MPAAGSPAEQISVHIQRAVADGTSRITVQLNPVELGHVEVQLDFAQDGRVSATILADRPETLDMLQRDARALERSLQSAGLQTDGGSLSFDLRGGSQQGSGSHNLAGGNQGQAGNGETQAQSHNRRAATAEPAAPVLTGSSDGGVDIHV
jgi:flagellar hook-length control protein FliK